MSKRLDFFRRKEPCRQCPTKKFFLQDGLTFCENGHQQDVATQTETIDDGRGLARKTRKRKELIDKVSRVYRGASAKELFLQAYQFILWKQCYAFIQVIGFPPELETVVKDLWALRLQLLKDKVDATPNEEVLFSSQLPASESEQENDDQKRRKTVLDKAMPSLMDSIALCYLGMVLLRLPVSVGDLHRWVIRDDVPFIRAIRFVPAIIKEKLPAEYTLVLDTTSVLELDQINKAVNNLSLFYGYHFDINLPPLNFPLLLFKHIKGLTLPTSLFPMVQSMAALLSIDFVFPVAARYVQVSSSPEVSLICLLVIAVKLYHPFDSLRCSVASINDCAVLQINWSKWTEAQASHKSRMRAGLHFTRGSEMDLTEENAMQMSDEQLDDYLDWYERTWIDEDRARFKTRPLDEDFRKWFPVGRQDGSLPARYDFGQQSKKEQHSTEQLSKEVAEAMMLRDVISEEEEQEGREGVRRVGSHYKRYRSSEELTANALAFHDAVASAIGLKLETLLESVLQIEQKLIERRKARPRDRRQARLIRESHSPVQRDAGGSVEADETEIDDDTHDDGNRSGEPLPDNRILSVHSR